ncbi:MAG: hypothetical protein CMP07_14550 [Xanthomonadales bacterium]|nr:hypothetical protein [Xanthomonadales bacterium]|tara:strand:+ start:391 stop:1956 length:1566 start_codon:yes stop_codon:yes gene_type:complete
MKIRNPIRKTALAVAIASVSILANAQDVTLYESHVLPDALVFEPNSTIGMNTDIDIVVKGPDGLIIRQSFQAGEAIEFNPAAMSAGGLPDGNYRYELQITDIKGVSARRGADGTADAVQAIPQPGFGSFSILNGKLVSPGAEEAPYTGADAGTSVQSSIQPAASDSDEQTRAQTIAQDLNVQGSLCVGQDCTSSESFGFDTIRMKENNTRIKFDDTSNSGSFPNNDWQLTANESGNGGLNKFSIENTTVGRIPFTIEGPAPSNSLYVDDAGNIGIGTSAPVVETHIVDGDSPTVRLQQDGSSGFTPQVFDIAANEANFFVRDVTNGSQLPFRIKPGADSDSLFIAANNNIGMGTANPSSQLHVSNAQSAGGMTFKMTETGNSAGTGPGANQDWELTIRDADGGLGFNDPDTGGAEMFLTTDGNLTIKGTLTTATQTIPDYVFEDSYVLRPLEEVSSFIDAFGHLPGIPSAKEYAKRGGVNLSELQILLLEKVEELTLYTLQQQDTIKRLESEVNALRTSRD